jgi:hypothetical protein
VSANRDSTSSRSRVHCAIARLHHDHFAWLACYSHCLDAPMAATCGCCFETKLCSRKDCASLHQTDTRLADTDHTSTSISWDGSASPLASGIATFELAVVYHVMPSCMQPRSAPTDRNPDRCYHLHCDCLCNPTVWIRTGCRAVRYLDSADGVDWVASSTTSADSTVRVAADVPGDIISDLHAAGVVGNPLYELNFRNNSLWQTVR